MIRTRLVMTLVGSFLALPLLVGVATADEAVPPEATIVVSPAAPIEGDTVTVAGTGCVPNSPGPDGNGLIEPIAYPAQVYVVFTDYVVPILVDSTGNWKYEIDLGALPAGDYSISATCDRYTTDFQYEPLTFTVTDPVAESLTVVPDKITSAMLGDPAKGVAVLGSGFLAGQSVSVTVTDPNGVVYALADEVVAEDGSVSFGVYYESGVAPLGTYTVSVVRTCNVNFSGVPCTDSATATFTVVAEKVINPPKTKNSQDLAATGVKLDVPLVLSTGGLLVLAGAGALAMAHRRENRN